MTARRAGPPLPPLTAAPVPPPLPDSAHISLVCRLNAGRPHRPCSGTCDRYTHATGPLKETLCGGPCDCECHRR